MRPTASAAPPNLRPTGRTTHGPRFSVALGLGVLLVTMTAPAQAAPDTPDIYINKAVDPDDDPLDPTAALLMTKTPNLRGVACSGTYTTESRASLNAEGQAQQTGERVLDARLDAEIETEETVHWQYSCKADGVRLKAVILADDETDLMRELHIQVINEEGTWRTEEYCSIRTPDNPGRRCSRTFDPITGAKTDVEMSPLEGTKSLPTQAEVCVDTPKDGVRAVEQSRVDIPPVANVDFSVFKRQIDGWSYYEEACKVVDIDFEGIDAELPPLLGDLLPDDLLEGTDVDPTVTVCCDPSLD